MQQAACADARGAFDPALTIARRTLADAINAARRVCGIRGDQLVALHDAKAGRELAQQATSGLAARIAEAHGGDIIEFCRKVKGDVPSAKPSRMSYPEGMKEPAVRTQLRGQHISGWGHERLCAVANSMDYDVEYVLVKRRPAAGEA